MKIGIVCYPSFGGSGVIATELAIGLARRGHRVHVISTAPPARPLPESENLLFHQVSVTDYPLFEHPPYELAIASKIVEVSEKHHLDLVNVHYAVPHSTSAHLAKQVLGAAGPRFVTTLHGTDITRVGIDPSYLSITRFTISQSDGVTVPSEFLRDAAARILGPKVPIEIIPNFVDTDHFAPSTTSAPSEPVVFHVSNFRPVKRILDLIDVLELVRRRLPAQMILVGDGPDRARAADRAAELGVADYVQFLGKRADFAGELARADAFLLPSELESFGLAALEAMSAGVPVVGYRVGGLSEVVVDGVTGTLVEPFDRGALAAALVELLENPKDRRRMAAAAREHVLEHFQVEPAIERYERYFQRIS